MNLQLTERQQDALRICLMDSLMNSSVSYEPEKEILTEIVRTLYDELENRHEG